MGKLSFYGTLEEKLPHFNQGAITHYRIDNASQFEGWYQVMKTTISNEPPFANFFRGVTEARYKLYNSAQRFWIRNNLQEIEALQQSLSYIDMVQKMVNNAKKVKLLQQVFEYYDLLDEQRDFPLLSILQHYAAPTPLMDWTYDLDVALFFAIDGLRPSEKGNTIDDYISVYRVNKVKEYSFMKNNLQFISGNIFPTVKGLAGYLADTSVVYISDFELAGHEDKQQRKIKPLTTYYNLNILAQKGLFIFNPNDSRPLEDFADLYPAEPDGRIFCYNISKDLAEFIKYRIGSEQIEPGFIYPELKLYAKSILDDYLKYVIG
ncbi:MAG TPA: FRG domain-containing protein [Puia sp.]|nr:FRG domain-containing protein [Puia sp.]